MVRELSEWSRCFVKAAGGHIMKLAVCRHARHVSAHKCIKRIFACACMHACGHICTLERKGMHTPAHMHTHMHTCIHTRMQTLTKNTPTHSPSVLLITPAPTQATTTSPRPHAHPPHLNEHWIDGRVQAHGLLKAGLRVGKAGQVIIGGQPPPKGIDLLCNPGLDPRTLS